MRGRAEMEKEKVPIDLIATPRLVSLALGRRKSFDVVRGTV